jgi:hypothetical protein
MGPITWNPLVNVDITNWKDPPFFMGKTQFLMGQSQFLMGKTQFLMGQIHYNW